uniref:Uncharacterized protein n=1 Tax=Oryza punctata TaxID=4537 RepID=A0A0E0L8A7_ORYPU
MRRKEITVVKMQKPLMATVSGDKQNVVLDRDMAFKTGYLTGPSERREGATTPAPPPTRRAPASPNQAVLPLPAELRSLPPPPRAVAVSSGGRGPAGGRRGLTGVEFEDDEDWGQWTGGVEPSGA